MRHMRSREDMTPIDRKCLEQGITRAELSRASGVPVRTLEGWSARVRTNPNVYQLYKVAKVLGCTMEDLIEPELAEKAITEGTGPEE